MFNRMKTQLGKRGQDAAASGSSRSRPALGNALPAGGAGQVVVEMLLILPVFLTIVFTIMEMGYLAFWVIVVNHATYECARIGALKATPRYGGEPRDVVTDMQKVMSRIIPEARVSAHTEPTVFDNQAGIMNHDIVVTGSYDVKLIFPISNVLLSIPKGSGRRPVRATLRVPIEQPLQQGESDQGFKGGKKKFKKGP